MIIIHHFLLPAVSRRCTISDQLQGPAVQSTSFKKASPSPPTHTHTHTSKVFKRLRLPNRSQTDETLPCWRSWSQTSREQQHHTSSVWTLFTLHTKAACSCPCTYDTFPPSWWWISVCACVCVIQRSCPDPFTYFLRSISVGTRLANQAVTH